MTTTIVILASLTLVAFVISTAQLLLARFYLRWRRPFPAGLRRRATATDCRSVASERPFVSILKPICGIEDGLAENLERFVAIEGVGYEVVFSIADERDPAVRLIEDLCVRHPEAPFRLVKGNRDWSIRNPKVDRLVAASRVARGELLLISDAQVRMESGDIAKTIDAFRDSAVGCVSNPFVGEGSRTLGAAVESAHLLNFVAAGSILAAVAKVPCVVGKSMALRREVLSAIGGFESFANLLAEDQAIALAVKRAGYRIVLAPIVVRNYVERKSLEQTLDRQIRWNKIRYSFSRPLYWSEIVAQPFPLAVLLAAAVAAAGGVLTAVSLVIVAAIVRSLQAFALATTLGCHDRALTAAVTPLQELLQFYAQFVPFFSSTVNWRGHRARLGRGTEIMPVEA